jgi:TonB family protein
VYASVIAFLLAGTAAFAQGTPAKIPDSGANRNFPGQNRPHSLQLIQAVEVEVLSDTTGLDFGPYLRLGVMPYVRENWRLAIRTKGLAPASERKTLAVEFAILKDGGLDNMQLTESSGDTELDSTALDGVTKAAPFAALPAGFASGYLQLRCRFNYNPSAAMQFRRGGMRSGGANWSVDNGPAAENALHGNNGATMPRVVYQTTPEYSAQARKAKVQGTVVLMLTVTERGDVAHVQVMRGLGSGLDEKAVESVGAWKFKPGTRDGAPIRSEIAVEINFHLLKGR